jgi:NDP-4-keto-2,6-dideoxyhexose 3-C-methyltransferase
MEISLCRSCKSNKLIKTFDLGFQKLSGIFPISKNQNNIPEGSLAMVFCDKCKLLQLKNSFDENIMYGDDYGYMSSLNNSMIEHLYKKSINLKKLANLYKGDLIVDIGSNDGTFLSFFSNKFQLIGIDPTIKKLEYDVFSKMQSLMPKEEIQQKPKDQVVAISFENALKELLYF